jgi:hypothetical protein
VGYLVSCFDSTMNHGGIKQRIYLSSVLIRGADPFVDRESIVGTRGADPQRREWGCVKSRHVHTCMPIGKAKKSEQALGTAYPPVRKKISFGSGSAVVIWWYYPITPII